MHPSPLWCEHLDLAVPLVALLRRFGCILNKFTLTNTLAVYYCEAHQKELANCKDNHFLPMEKKCFYAVISE